MVYDESQKDKHFQSFGCGRRRAHIGSILLYCAEEKENRPDKWMRPVARGKFAPETTNVFKSGDSPVQKLIDKLGRILRWAGQEGRDG